VFVTKNYFLYLYLVFFVGCAFVNIFLPSMNLELSSVSSPNNDVLKSSNCRCISVSLYISLITKQVSSVKGFTLTTSTAVRRFDPYIINIPSLSASIRQEWHHTLFRISETKLYYNFQSTESEG
jgi:hypothetical protein